MGCGVSQAHIHPAAMGASRKCVKTWIDRQAAEGEPGLRDRSSQPHRMPTRTAAEIEQRIVDLRCRERRGPDWIGAELAAPARTVSRVLARHGVPRLAVLDPMTGEVIRASKMTAVRFERDRPGELVHMDVKKIGRIPTALGQVTSRTRHHEAYDPAADGLDTEGSQIRLVARSEACDVASQKVHSVPVQVPARLASSTRRSEPWGVGHWPLRRNRSTRRCGRT